MKTKVYVEKAVQQWRNMFSCGEDTTVDDHDDDDPAANAIKKQTTKSSKRNGKSKETGKSNWLRQVTAKLAEYGNIERMDTDSTLGYSQEEESEQEESRVPVPVIKTIRKVKKTASTAIETKGSNSIVANETLTRTKTKKKKTRGRKKRLGRNPPREKFYQTVVYDLGYDAEEENEPEQDIPITAPTTQQDKNDSATTTTKEKSTSTTSQSIASHDAFSISVLTMKEFDEDGNFADNVLHKEEQDYNNNNNNNNAKKMAQMMKGIDIKSSIARVRHYKKKQAEEEQRREHDELRREQEELLQKRLQQKRREKERKEQEEKLQEQLELQKKRDQAKQSNVVDQWEDEYSLDGDGNNNHKDDSSLNYSISTKSHPSAGIRIVKQPSSSTRLAPPSRIVLPLFLTSMEEEEEGKEEGDELRLIVESPSDEEDAPSDEDEDASGEEKIKRKFSLVPKQLEDTKDDWESFEGSHVFHMGLGKKYYTQWGHYKTSGFKWGDDAQDRPRAKNSVDL